MSHFADAGSVPNRDLVLGISCYVHIDPEPHNWNIQSAYCLQKFLGIIIATWMDGTTRSRRVVEIFRLDTRRV